MATITRSTPAITTTIPASRWTVADIPHPGFPQQSRHPAAPCTVSMLARQHQQVRPFYFFSTPAFPDNPQPSLSPWQRQPSIPSPFALVVTQGYMHHSLFLLSLHSFVYVPSGHKIRTTVNMEWFWHWYVDDSLLLYLTHLPCGSQACVGVLGILV